MSTRVRIEVTDGNPHYVVDCDVNGGTRKRLGKGDHYDFKIGVEGSMVQMMTLKRIDDGNVRVTPLDGDVTVELPGPDKRLRKHRRLDIDNRVRRALVKEMVK